MKTGMDRRGFLKACGVVTSSMLVIPALRLIVPDQSLRPGESWLANARELFQFDLDRQAWLMRLDIHSDMIQLGIDALIPGSTFPSAQQLNEARIPAAQVLHQAMIDEGLTLADLKPMPIPAGYITPDWAKAA